MKSLLLILILILSQATIAQNAPILSGPEGFEEWEPAETGQLPKHWDGFNRNIVFGGMQVGTIECITKDSTDPYSGQYSARLESKSIVGGDAVPGMLTTGDLLIDFNSQSGDIEGGLAYDLQPVRLKGHYKYAPAMNDTAFISVWAMENGVQIGLGRIEISTAQSNWTEFTVDIHYAPGSAPDTINVLFSSSNKEGAVPVGSVLEVDAVYFEQPQAGQNELNDIKWNIYPNPTQESISIDNSTDETVEVELIQMDGKILQTNNLAPGNHTIPLHNTTKGTHLLRVGSGSQKKTYPIIIQ